MRLLQSARAAFSVLAILSALPLAVNADGLHIPADLENGIHIFEVRTWNFIIGRWRQKPRLRASFPGNPNANITNPHEDQGYKKMYINDVHCADCKGNDASLPECGLNSVNDADANTAEAMLSNFCEEAPKLKAGDIILAKYDDAVWFVCDYHWAVWWTTHHIQQICTRKEIEKASSYLWNTCNPNLASEASIADWRKTYGIANPEGFICPKNKMHN